jgi:predicted DNA-binding transcriptional regulator YafY
MAKMKEVPVKRKSAKRGEGFSVVDTSLRYLEMLEIIPRDPDEITVEAIMQVLERRGFSINKRSIQRDLHKLAPIFKLLPSGNERPIRWSYSDKAPVRLFPSMDEHTALSFQLMQAFMQHLLPPETLDSINPWFRKAAERLSQRKEVAARWQEKIHVLPLGLPRQPPAIDPKIQDEVYQALLYELPLRIHYRGRNSERFKEYLISPLGLVVRDYVSYVVAAKNDDGELRQFLLHRFKDAEIEDGEYYRPNMFNLKAYAADKFGFQLGPSATMDIKMWLDKDIAINVAECPVDKRQALTEQADGSFLLSATVPNTQELLRWIYSLGNQAEVLQPLTLRNKIKGEFAAVSKRYQTRKSRTI